jgi:AcrR family transcriptional regulator
VSSRCRQSLVRWLYEWKKFAKIAVKAPTRDAEATRSSILDAAEHEFAKVGLWGARTESIAARTGVTKAMIHYYFENKEKSLPGGNGALNYAPQC